MRPFVNRVRHTPDSASKPDRLEKDLANVKILASRLEEEAAMLRKAKPQKQLAVHQTAGGTEAGDEQEVKGDISMTDEQADEDEPKERGSDAVERRIQKVMREMRDQGVVDADDEKAFQDRKVRRHVSFCLSILTGSS